MPTRAQRGQAAVIDPTGKYAAGAAAAAAERRSGMTADQVVEVEGGGEEGGGLVVALRDAAGGIPDVLLRVWRSTSAAAVRAAAGKELIRRGVHTKTVSRLLFSGKFLRDEDCLVGVVIHACMDVAACLCQSSNLTRCCCSQLALCACAYIVSSQMEALESATSQKGSKGLDTRPVLSFFLSLFLFLFPFPFLFFFLFLFLFLFLSLSLSLSLFLFLCALLFFAFFDMNRRRGGFNPLGGISLLGR